MYLIFVDTPMLSQENMRKQPKASAETSVCEWVVLQQGLKGSFYTLPGSVWYVHLRAQVKTVFMWFTAINSIIQTY